MPVSLTQFAFTVVRQGISANEGLRMLREQGLHVRRGTWLSMVGGARAQFADRMAELDRSLRLRPKIEAKDRVPTKTHRGFIQYADLFVRNKGDVKGTWVQRALHTDRLLSRQQVIDRLVDKERAAVSRAASRPAPFGTPLTRTVEGGIYTGTHQFVPEDEISQEE